MTIRDIMNEVAYGEDFVKRENVKSYLLEAYDADQDLLLASQCINKLEDTMFFEENNKVARLIDKMRVKLESVENRISSGKVLSEAYKRMSSSGIVEDYKNIMNIVNNKIELKKIGSYDKLAKVLATAKFATKKYVNPRAVFVESTNPILNIAIKQEYEIINEVL